MLKSILIYSCLAICVILLVIVLTIASVCSGHPHGMC